MSNSAVNGKVDLENLIETTWSPMYYQELYNTLQIASLFNRDYEGDIKKKGDTVLVNVIRVAPAETLTDDKQKFKATKIQVEQKSITVNRRTVHSVEITDLASLQSMPFMEELKSKMVYQVRLKMEQEIVGVLLAAATQYAIATSGTYVKDDFIDARTKAADLLWNNLPGRYAAFGNGYYGDLLKSSVLTSTDFVDNKPLLDQKIPNIFGFGTFENDLQANDSAIFFHESALQVVIQKGMQFKISDLHGQQKFAYLLSVDVIWDVAVFDENRVFTQANTGASIALA